MHCESDVVVGKDLDVFPARLFFDNFSTLINSELVGAHSIAIVFTAFIMVHLTAKDDGFSMSTSIVRARRPLFFQRTRTFKFAASSVGKDFIQNIKILVTALVVLSVSTGRRWRLLFADIDILFLTL